MRTRYVYVVEQGMYSDRGVVGVYVSPEAAMADHPIPADPKVADRARPPGWHQRPDAVYGHEWNNGLDFDQAKTIRRYEVEGFDPSSSGV